MKGLCVPLFGPDMKILCLSCWGLVRGTRCKCSGIGILLSDNIWTAIQLPLGTNSTSAANLRTPRPSICSPKHIANVFFSHLQAQKFITAYSAFLKRQGKLPIPGWVDTVKTSASNELPPQDADWYDHREIHNIRA